ncbi:MAG: HD domain-containing protein [Holosporales bacterium]|jgi:HD superfamily phosphohydrolase|nr:HD domain-containing protein [Holosporales bacterium]
MKFFCYKLKILVIVLFGTFCYSGCNTSENHDFSELDAVMGKETSVDSKFSEILASKVMQRLKGVDQAGPPRYLTKMLPSFSRYEHSLGVLALLKKANVSQKEQVTGILHDASHVVFSHVGDHIYAKNINAHTEESYQDSIHSNYLRESGIEKILKKFGLSVDDVDIKRNGYSALEQSLPDMCADRIQYNIHTGVLLGKISKKDASKIISNLTFQNDKWFFTDAKIARKFADLSLYFTQNFWGAKWNTSMNIHFANVLREALRIRLIKHEDLFLTDDVIMERILKSKNRVIQLNLQQCKHSTGKIFGAKYKTDFFRPKFRGIDPLISDKFGKMCRLTEIDHEFRKQYDSVKIWCKNGFEIDILVQ